MIRLAYDLEVDALYIEVGSGDFGRTEEIDPGTLVDVAADGTVLGIEVISPDRRWPLEDIISRYPLDARDVAELTAYFPRKVTGAQPAHRRASARVLLDA